MSGTAGARASKQVDLAQVSMPRLLFALLHQRFSGTLAVDQPPPHAGPRLVWFRGGMPAFTNWIAPTEVLGQVLVAQHLIDENQLLQALEAMAVKGGLLGQHLLAHGVIDQARLYEGLRYQCTRKLLALFDLRAGEARVTVSDGRELEPSLLPVNVLGLILAGVTKSYDETRVEAEMGPALRAPMRATNALARYRSHFRFRPADEPVLSALTAGAQLASLATLSGSNLRRAAQLIYTLWACQMLRTGAAAGAQVGGTPGAGVSAIPSAAASSGPSAAAVLARTAPAVPAPPASPASARPAPAAPAPPASARPAPAAPASPASARPAPAAQAPAGSAPVAPTSPAPAGPAPAAPASPASASPASPAASAPSPASRTTAPERPPAATPQPSPAPATTPASSPTSASGQASAPSTTTDDSDDPFIEDLVALEKKVDENAHAFRLFNVPLSAGKKEIRRAWGDLSRKFHPDALKAEGREGLRDRVNRVFAALSEAQQLLNDAEERTKLRDAVESGEHDAVKGGKDATATARAVFQSEMMAKDGDKLLRANRFDRALAQYREAATYNPDEPDLQAAIAWCEYQVSDKDSNAAAKARNTLNAIIEDSPNIARAHYFLGFVLVDQSSPAVAIEIFRKAARLDPRLIDAERQARALEVKIGRTPPPVSRAPAKPKRSGLKGLFGKK